MLLKIKKELMNAKRTCKNRLDAAEKKGAGKDQSKVSDCMHNFWAVGEGYAVDIPENQNQGEEEDAKEE